MSKQPQSQTNHFPEDQKAISTFIEFLYQQKLLPFHDSLLFEGKFLNYATFSKETSNNNDGDNPSSSSSSSSSPKQYLITKYRTLLDCIQHYFHYFQENTLKVLITEALNYRNKQLVPSSSSSSTSPSSPSSSIGIESNQQLLGEWALIIDTMKLVLQQRRDLASQHFQELIGYGMEGKPETVNFYLKQLFTNGFIDHLFVSILTDTLTAMAQQKTKNEENYYMLTYFQKIVLELQTENKVKEELERQQYQIQQVSLSSLPPSDVSATAKSVTLPSTTSSSGEKAPAVLPLRDEQLLIQYSQLLNQYIKESQGNVTSLEQKLITWFEQKEFIGHQKDFEFILQENMKACQQANYQNKLKLLQYIENFTKNYFLNQQEKDSQIQQLLHVKDAEVAVSKLSTYHAPQFIDRGGGKGTGELKNIFIYQPLFSASHLVFNEQSSSQSVPIPTNNKKKKLFRKQMKQKKHAFLQEINEFLYKYGWVVIDHCIPLELTKRVRIESNLFRHFYEQSEIWVGKKADVGAHLQVPSIRGDRVLWVCGGHNVLNSSDAAEEEDNEDDEDKAGDEGGGGGSKGRVKKGNHAAPEGVSRVIKTFGEIEPCKLEVKASAPLRKFSALKDAITTFDKLIEELKHFKDERGYNNRINSIYERSDAMLSIYPGDGARFANHIDNTTKDGRVLSVVTYLNPVWTAEMGGAIRLRPTRHNYQPASTEATNVAVGNTSDKAVNEGKFDAATLSTTSASAGDKKFPRFHEYDGIDIYPLAGRTVLFFSSQIEHEVLPTYGDRHAITVWYYDRQERKEAIERAKQDGAVQKVATSSVETQQEAKRFISELMGGDEITEDGGNPTEEELQGLVKKVESLSDEILEIIASITGAPSVQSFRQGFPLLTVQDLKSMRALFRRMGLQQN